MSRIAVLGAGLIGSAIAIDLARDHDVTSIDINEIALANVHKKNSKIIPLKSDLCDYEHYNSLLSSYNYVISAVPGFMGYKTLESVLQAKKDIVDISFSPQNCLGLDFLARENNVTAIIDCGVAPGMSNLILGYHNERMKIEQFECLVGGLPKLRTKPFEYKAPFSPVDVIEEYTRPARYIENGHLVTKPALSDSELLDFEKAGTLECFNTDGLRSVLFTMADIPNMKEKTLRYPGHVDFIKALMKAGFFDLRKFDYKGYAISPLEFSSAVLFNQWKLGAEEEEFTLMKIKISGTEGKQAKTITYDLYDEYDRVTNTSSMARTTGYACNAVLHLLVNENFNAKGVFPPEIVGKNEACFNKVMGYLAARNITYIKKETPII